MDVGHRSDEDSPRVGQMNFDRLEQSVEYLVREHERLTSEHKALLAELAAREHTIKQLQSQLNDEAGRRSTAVEGVDKILARLEQLRASVTANAEATHE